MWWMWRFWNKKGIPTNDISVFSLAFCHCLKVWFLKCTLLSFRDKKVNTSFSVPPSPQLLWIKYMASYRLGKCSTTQLCPQPSPLISHLNPFTFWTSFSGVLWNVSTVDEIRFVWIVLTTLDVYCCCSTHFQMFSVTYNSSPQEYFISLFSC